MKIRTIYEDEDVVVVDKPAGIVVHEGIGTEEKDTLIYRLRAKIHDKDSKRPGVVHRLDKDTSGVLVVAKTAEAKDFLQKQFKAREVEKTYVALVHGVPKEPEAVLDWPVARHLSHPIKRMVHGKGKAAQTRYKIVENYGKYALLRIWPLTGRTHQIRVHLAHLGHPIVGDQLYGNVEDEILDRQFLHAKELKIKLPNGKSHKFESELPPDLNQVLKSLV